MMDSKTALQEVETSLQETLAKVKEIEKLEEKVAKQSQGEEKSKEILEPSPQPSLGSYYNLLEAGKIIPQNFVVPLFFTLEKEWVRTLVQKMSKNLQIARIRLHGQVTILIHSININIFKSMHKL